MKNDESSVTRTGHLHPLSLITARINAIFTEMGFSIADGPQIVTEYNNFDSLNMPPHHPARDMWDTFWLKPLEDRKLLQTHISSLQVPYMKTHKPPLAMISTGRVFRYEATDATHETQFHYTEGLLVDKHISLANLKYVLETFLKKMFGEDLNMRFRPSYFPFVEPGVEIDMSCFKCKGTGCSTCKHTGWIEIMGAGVVHPKVLENGGIDPNVYSGLAFGMGVDRIAMLVYGIDDIRLLYAGDLRLVSQF